MWKRSLPTSRTFAAAWVEMKNDVVFVFSHSGGPGSAADHDAFSTHMAYPPTGTELGVAVRRALEASRHLDTKKLGKAAVEKFLFVDAQKQHEQWLKQAMQLTGAKSESGYYRDVKACALRRVDGRIKLTPTLDGAGSWDEEHQATDADLRHFPVDASDEEIQVAVLEALSISR